MNSTKHKKPGILILENYKMLHVPNFIDYLQSGLQINLVAAIDFTGKYVFIYSLKWYPNKC